MKNTLLVVLSLLLSTAFVFSFRITQDISPFIAFSVVFFAFAIYYCLNYTIDLNLRLHLYRSLALAFFFAFAHYIIYDNWARSLFYFAYLAQSLLLSFFPLFRYSLYKCILTLISLSFLCYLLFLTFGLGDSYMIHGEIYHVFGFYASDSSGSNIFRFFGITSEPSASGLLLAITLIMSIKYSNKFLKYLSTFFLVATLSISSYIFLLSYYISSFIPSTLSSLKLSVAPRVVFKFAFVILVVLSFAFFALSQLSYLYPYGNLSDLLSSIASRFTLSYLIDSSSSRNGSFQLVLDPDAFTLFGNPFFCNYAYSQSSLIGGYTTNMFILLVCRGILGFISYLILILFLPLSFSISFLLLAFSKYQYLVSLAPLILPLIIDLSSRNKSSFQ